MLFSFHSPICCKEESNKNEKYTLNSYQNSCACKEALKAAINMYANSLQMNEIQVNIKTKPFIKIGLEGISR